MEVARTLQGFIDSTDSGDFDLMIGDFNMTPRSAALAIVAGDNENAFGVAGSGWGGTWTRTRPLLRVDHALVRPELEVLDARTFDAHTTHLGLLVTLAEPRDEAPGTSAKASPVPPSKDGSALSGSP